MHILLAEDDQQIGSALCDGLARLGFSTEWVSNGLEVESLLQRSSAEVVVLDIGLPGKDGFSLLKDIRKSNADLPILILTALDDPALIVRGLDQGADDYVTKPFDLHVLAARLRALIRRNHDGELELIEHGDLMLNPNNHEVNLNGISLDIQGNEYLLLETLLKNKGRILSRSRLEQEIYGFAEGVESNTIEVYIHHLRKRLGKDFIRTMRGLGYTVPKI